MNRQAQLTMKMNLTFMLNLDYQAKITLLIILIQFIYCYYYYFNNVFSFLNLMTIINLKFDHTKYDFDLFIDFMTKIDLTPR